MKPQTRYIPQNSTFIPHETGAVVYYFTTPTGKPAAIAYNAGAIKNHAWKWAFHTEDERTAYTENWFNNLSEHAAKIAADRATAKTWRHDWTPGTILDGSWGYDQTNIEYYQVISVSPTSNSITIREIAQETVPGSSGRDFSDQRTPCPGQFIGPERRALVQRSYNGEAGLHITLRPNERDGYRIYLDKWDGRPRYCSWGH